LLSGEITAEQAKRWSEAGVDLSKLSAGLAAFVAGADVDAAAAAGGNAAENNAIFTISALITAAAIGLEALDKYLLGKDVVDFFVAGQEGDTARQAEIAEGLLIGAAVEVTVGNIIPGSYASIKAALKAGDVGLARKLLAKASPEAAEWVARKSGKAVEAITETFGGTYTKIAKKTGLPELPGWEGSLSARRLEPGAASHGSNLPRIVEGETWLKGTAGNAGKIPSQIAEKLNGREFKNFDKFREAFWMEVAADPVLSKQFSKSNRKLMSDGYAPYAVDLEHVGGRVKYELDHAVELQHGGNVYDMNNIVIRSPYNHIHK
jgi:filamentous hemagglutinin